METKYEYKSAEEAVRQIKSGDRVFIQGGACTPSYLISHLAKRKDELRDVELVFITVYGDLIVDAPEYADSFHINTMFVSASVRNSINEGRADFIPVFLSEIPELFRRGVLPLDVAIVQVSPPDKKGYCSMGVSVDIARSAVNSASHVIAQVNPRVPRTHGDSFIHSSQFDAMVFTDEPLHAAGAPAQLTAEEMKIGEHIAPLVSDRSTLQLGIGCIPDAVCKFLTNHKDLGVHTEMFSDGLIELCEKGVVTNKYKSIHPNKTVSGFAFGTTKLYDYVDDNPAFAFLDIDYVNEPSVIKRNKKVVAINSAVEIDITGQVCSDSIGTYQYSGIGGQMDFIRAASLSEDGKPIIALTSRTKKGLPRIVPLLKPGAGVVTTRGHVHYVVTEYGVASLFGQNLRQRAKALINIAHPDDREALSKACHERFKIFN
ncbi:MAG: acetyl-CoA hydrolase/transferase family protein [Chitinophagales bacterium]|nr:acetyl-CoA hydrolase/transferase family protein [Chitinophagales bacterium]